MRVRVTFRGQPILIVPPSSVQTISDFRQCITDDFQLLFPHLPPEPCGHIKLKQSGFILPLNGLVKELISPDDEIDATVASSSSTSHDSSSTLGMATGTENWTTERLISHNLLWQQNIASHLSSSSSSSSSCSLIVKSLIPTVQVSTDKKILSSIPKFFSNPNTISQLGVDGCIEVVCSLFKYQKNQQHADLVTAEILASLAKICRIAVHANSVRSFDLVMELITDTIASHPAECIELLNVVTTVSEEVSPSTTSTFTCVPVECIVPLMNHSSNPSVRLLSIRSLLRTAEESFGLLSHTNTRSRGGGQTANSSVFSETRKINFLNILTKSSLLSIMSTHALGVITARLERNKAQNIDQKNLLGRKKFRRLVRGVEEDDDQAIDIDPYFSDLSDESSSDSNSDSDSDSSNDSDEEAEREKQIVLQWHSEISPSILSSDKFLLTYCLLICVLCSEEGGGGLGRKLTKQTSTATKTLLAMATLPKVFGESEVDQKIIGRRRQRQLKLRGGETSVRDADDDDDEQVETRLAIIASIRSSSSSAISELARNSRSRTIYQDKNFTLNNCLKMITGGYNLAVCIGANRLGYMMKRILVNGGGGEFEEDSEGENDNDNDNDNDSDGEKEEECERKNSRPKLSKGKLTIITKSLLKASLTCGCNARLCALEVLANSISISQRGKQMLMKLGGSSLLVEILLVATEGSAGEEKLLHQEKLLRIARKSEGIDENVKVKGMAILGSWSGGGNDCIETDEGDENNLYLSLASDKILTRIIRSCCRILANLAATSPQFVDNVRSDLRRANIFVEDLGDEMAREYLKLIFDD